MHYMHRMYFSLSTIFEETEEPLVQYLYLANPYSLRAIHFILCNLAKVLELVPCGHEFTNFLH